MTDPETALMTRLGTLVVRTLGLPPDTPISARMGLDGRGFELDSVDALRLLAEIEEEFDITVDDAEITPATFQTLGSLAELVRPRT